MKPSELRIGNYVYRIDRRTDVHLPITWPLKVLKIGIFNCECLPIDKIPAQEKDWFEIANKDLDPIPLTEKWLEDFGFYKKEDCDGWFRGRLIFYNGYLSELQDYLIQYVHQLQNLYFALTGTELVKGGGNE